MSTTCKTYEGEGATPADAIANMAKQWAEDGGRGDCLTLSDLTEPHGVRGFWYAIGLSWGKAEGDNGKEKMST